MKERTENKPQYVVLVSKKHIRLAEYDETNSTVNFKRDNGEIVEIKLSELVGSKSERRFVYTGEIGEM